MSTFLFLTLPNISSVSIAPHAFPRFFLHSPFTAWQIAAVSGSSRLSCAYFDYYETPSLKLHEMTLSPTQEIILARGNGSPSRLLYEETILWDSPGSLPIVRLFC